MFPTRPCSRLWPAVPALILFLALALSLSPALAGQPTNDIKSIVDEVLSILQNPVYQEPAKKRERLKRIEQALVRRLDYQEMAKRCLGQHWAKLTQAQQKEFVHLFTELLQASYADRLDEFAKTKMIYEEEILTGDHAEVRTKVLRQNDRIPVNFRLLNEPQGWMIYDLVIEGVSLVSNYRSQFSKVINASSFDELINCLQLKMKANDLERLDTCPPEEAVKAKAKGKDKS